jgi:hypothetical protein
MAVAKKVNVKYDPEEVPHLLFVAQDKINPEPHEAKYNWIYKLTQPQAVEILVTRFSSLITSLVDVCHKGRYFTSYTKSFLRLWGHKNTPLANIALFLKKECASYAKEELMHLGKVAIAEAIAVCEKNLASTIIYTFKERIKDITNKPVKAYLELELTDIYEGKTNFETDIYINDFLDSLPMEDALIVSKIIEGEKVTIPPHLKKIIKEFLK